MRMTNYTVRRLDEIDTAFAVACAPRAPRLV